MRGVAAVLVMLHHAMLHLGVGAGVAPIQTVLLRGYLGVDLFFVLSGFVLAMTYGDWFDGRRGSGVRTYLRFMVRRVARLWPLHAAVLVLLLVAGLVEPAYPYSARQIAANFAMIQAWGVSRAINPPAWSVSAEMFAYTVFPLLVPLAMRGRVRPAICLAGLVLALAACMAGGPPLGPGRRGLLDVYFNDSLFPLLRCIAGFLAGMLAWRAVHLPAVHRLAATPWAAPVLLAAAPAALLAGLEDGVVFATFPFLVLAVHLGRGPAFRALAFGPVHRLGVLSYAIYLLHVFVLDYIDLMPGESWLELLLLGLITLAAATAAHALVEVPGRRLLRVVGEAVLDRRPLHGRAR